MRARAPRTGGRNLGGVTLWGNLQEEPQAACPSEGPLEELRCEAEGLPVAPGPGARAQYPGLQQGRLWVSMVFQVQADAMGPRAQGGGTLEQPQLSREQPLILGNGRDVEGNVDPVEVVW